MPKSDSKSVKIEQIDFTNSIQVRASNNNEVIDEYKDAMTNGEKFPAVMLFEIDGSPKLLVADGWHRIHASMKNDFKDILATVEKGTREEYVRAAVASNIGFGLRRSNADKRSCVLVAIKELKQLSDRQIADITGVSNVTVSSIRSEMATPEEAANPAKRIDKKGKTRSVKPLKKKEKKSTSTASTIIHPPKPTQPTQPTQAELVKAEEGKELFSILDQIVTLSKEAKKYISKKSFDQRAEIEQIEASCKTIRDCVKDEQKSLAQKQKEGAAEVKKSKAKSTPVIKSEIEKGLDKIREEVEAKKNNNEQQ